MNSKLDHLICISQTFRTSSVDTLTRWSVAPELVSERMVAIRSSLGLQELLVLSTCNRLEFYFFSSDFSADSWTQVPLLWKSSVAMNPDDWQVLHGHQAARHLLEVAASVDSMVIGETQILKQIKDALAQSSETGTAGKYLNLLIRTAIESSKRAYTETKIATNPVSVASMTYRFILNQADSSFPIVFVGAGDVIQSMVPYFAKMGRFHFVFVNRTIEKAEKLAARFGGSARSLKDFLQSPVNFTALISSTRSEEFLFDSDWIQSHSGRFGSVNRLFIDLANPPDVDPQAANLPHVKLINLDVIEKLAAVNNKNRESEISAVHKIIDEELLRLEAIYRERAADELLDFLPKEVEVIKSKAVEKLIKGRLNHLNESDQMAIREFADYLTGKIIQGPYLKAKEQLGIAD